MGKKEKRGSDDEEYAAGSQEEEKEEEEEVPSEALRRASHSELEVVPEEEEEEDEEEEEAEEMEGEEVTPNPHCQPGVRVRGGLIECSFEAHEAGVKPRRCSVSCEPCLPGRKNPMLRQPGPAAHCEIGW